MRKWKKAGTIGLIAVMLCASGAGCKKKATPERLFKDMAKNGETIESISDVYKRQSLYRIKYFLSLRK